MYVYGAALSYMNRRTLLLYQTNTVCGVAMYMSAKTHPRTNGIKDEYSVNVQESSR